MYGTRHSCASPSRYLLPPDITSQQTTRHGMMNRGENRGEADCEPGRVGSGGTAEGGRGPGPETLEKTSKEPLTTILLV